LFNDPALLLMDEPTAGASPPASRANPAWHPTS